VSSSRLINSPKLGLGVSDSRAPHLPLGGPRRSRAMSAAILHLTDQWKPCSG